jgi:transcriptional regulator with XRE-family HTH domain
MAKGAGVAEDAADMAELARFLRSRRARIDPIQVGLPRSRRYRSGLRREEVAILAGVSPTWYAYLEQGRRIRPSAAVLDSLAKVLLLSEEERQYMHQLVYGHRPQPLHHPPARRSTEAVEQLVACYGSGPYPVYVLDDIADVVAWNDAAATWYTDFAQLPTGHRNLMWWMLVAPAARERLADWQEECRDVVARYRAFVATRSRDPRVARFIAELRRDSPEFAQWWIEHEVRATEQRTRRFRHPVLGERVMRLQVLLPADTEALRIVFHLPVPPPTGDS